MPMVSWRACRHNGRTFAQRMYIVLIAWLFIIGTLALAAESTLAGLALFVGAGIVPAWFVVWIAARHAAPRNRERSRPLGDRAARARRR